jgi:hypothetical protein
LLNWREWTVSGSGGSIGPLVLMTTSGNVNETCI